MGRARNIARRSFLIGSAAIMGGVAFGTYHVHKPHDNPLLDQATGGDATYVRRGGFATSGPARSPDRVRPGEGLLGQTIRDRKRRTIRDVPADHVEVASGVGRSSPLELVCLPFVRDDEVIAVRGHAREAGAPCCADRCDGQRSTEHPVAQAPQA